MISLYDMKLECKYYLMNKWSNSCVIVVCCSHQCAEQEDAGAGGPAAAAANGNGFPPAGPAHSPAPWVAMDIHGPTHDGHYLHAHHRDGHLAGMSDILLLL